MKHLFPWKEFIPPMPFSSYQNFMEKSSEIVRLRRTWKELWKLIQAYEMLKDAIYDLDADLSALTEDLTTQVNIAISQYIDGSDFDTRINDNISQYIGGTDFDTRVNDIVLSLLFSYGILTYVENGVNKIFLVKTENDWNKLFINDDAAEYITFDNGLSIPLENIIGWEFNTSANTLVPDIIPDCFLSNCFNLNSNIHIPDNVIEIGNDFLFTESEGNFNSNIIFGNNLTKIGNWFLGGQHNFNKPISIPNVTTIGDGFLAHCQSFNQPISLPNVISIGNAFLYNCQSFNQPISLPKSTTIGSYFMQNCYEFNQNIDLPNVISIGKQFLYNCVSFNQPISLPKVTTIGDVFMVKCYEFNQNIDVPNITTIGNDFLAGCESFNQNIDLSNVTTIGNNFFDSCINFNKPLNLSKVISIGDWFMVDCISFNQDFTFSNTLQYVGDGCFCMTIVDESDYTLTLTINCDPDVFVDIIRDIHGHNQSLSFFWYDPNNRPIIVDGIYADEFKIKFPNYYCDYCESGRNFI